MHQEERPSSRVGVAIARVIGACTRRAWLVGAIALGMAGIAVAYAATHMAIDTDTSSLIASDLPWRQREIAFDAAFPQRVDLIAVVVDGATPELAEQAAAALTQRLSRETRLFHSVRRPDGGPFFEREGLLFLPTPEVATTMEHLIAAQPLLGTLAADPSLRGLMRALALMAQGGTRDPAALQAATQPLGILADAFEAVLTGKTPTLSWRTLVTGAAPGTRELRRFILVQPELDYTALQPGERATQAIRAAARELGLASDPRVRVRLTGPVPLADEELATLADGAALDSSIMLGSLVVLLWLALRSWRLVVGVLASLVVGLVVTAAFGLAIFGRFNLISVAFAVLFIGLGVDFGIQYCVAYRANRLAADDLLLALRHAGHDIGGALALAAVATALGFYAFVPTEYRGVSELGVIAGTGMLIAFTASITLLPALLVLLGPPPERVPVGYAWLAPLDRVVLRMRHWILALGVIAGLVSLALLPRLQFDFNPLNLRSTTSESVAALLDLMHDPETTPNTIDVLAPSVDAATALAERLAALPEVDHVLTVGTFVPDHQEEKLALIQDAALLLDPALNPVEVQPAPDDAQVARAMTDSANALQAMARSASGAGGVATSRLAHALARLAEATPADRERARVALVPGLVTLLGQLRAALAAQPVALATLPPDLVREWVAPDGRARIEVYPKGDANDNATLARFVAGVRRVAPDATGAPVSIQESSRTIVLAFVQAGISALVAIVLLLTAILRHLKSVLLTLAPLLLSGLVTLAICVVSGFPLNFENIIALPLLFGIGVAFDIYFIMAWRAGRTHVLESSLTRAVLFSALTTGTAFGSLWMSHHPGTSSMGMLLTLSLLCTLAAVLVFLPALLRTVPFQPNPPRAARPAG